MSTIKDALNKIGEFQSTPISHVHVVEPADSKPSAEAAEAPEDLFSIDIDWSKFTIDGVCVVDLLIRAINTLVMKYNEDVERRGTETDGLAFTFQDIYKIAGIADVDATVEAIKPEEETLASLYDKNGFGWRYYCTLKALERFETDANWDVEIDDNGFDGEFVAGLINRYFNPFSSLYNMFGGLDFVPGLRDALVNVDRKELTRLTLEKVLGNYSVLMTEAEPIEVEDEDENPKEPSNDKPEPKSHENSQNLSNDKPEFESPEKNPPVTKSRVVKPQVIQTLPDLLKAIGLSI